MRVYTYLSSAAVMQKAKVNIRPWWQYSSKSINLLCFQRLSYLFSTTIACSWHNKLFNQNGYVFDGWYILSKAICLKLMARCIKEIWINRRVFSSRINSKLVQQNKTTYVCKVRYINNNIHDFYEHYYDIDNGMGIDVLHHQKPRGSQHWRNHVRSSSRKYGWKRNKWAGFVWQQIWELDTGDL